MREDGGIEVETNRLNLADTCVLLGRAAVAMSERLKQQAGILEVKASA